MKSLFCFSWLYIAPPSAQVISNNIILQQQKDSSIFIHTGHLVNHFETELLQLTPNRSASQHHSTSASFFQTIPLLRFWYIPASYLKTDACKAKETDQHTLSSKHLSLPEWQHASYDLLSLLDQSHHLLGYKESMYEDSFLFWCVGVGMNFHQISEQLNHWQPSDYV